MLTAALALLLASPHFIDDDYAAARIAAAQANKPLLVEVWAPW
jgi:hypothetical protein